MSKLTLSKKETLAEMDAAVAEAVHFFMSVDDDLFDGHQTAREVLSHLVFWHREYLATLLSLLRRVPPQLKEGTFVELNCAATEEFASEPLHELAWCLEELQNSLRSALTCLSDWELDFPAKSGGRYRPVVDRVPAITSHIRRHLKRMRRAAKHGEEWIRAYYLESSSQEDVYRQD